MDHITHRVADCKASQDCRLWHRFVDGVEGSVFRRNPLEVRAFRLWRELDQFCRAVVDPDAATVVWGGGIQADPEVLYQGLLLGRPGKGFGSLGLAPGAE
jgi:hypothetical protein